MKRFLLATTLCGCALYSFAQSGGNRPPTGGGPHNSQPSNELTLLQRTGIIAMLQANVGELKRRNLLPAAPVNRTAQVSFAWPVKQANGYTDNGYYGISNYVDHDASLVSGQDYNCGTRSHNLPSGDNHRGTDIFTWPYAWQKMNQNAVEVVAAAEGVIIGKADGNTDRNCAPGTGSLDWNAVYLQHTDGTVTWYGHLKSGTLTNKAIGQTVAAGEYLGVVGSSGNSTSPHLHFEVYTNATCTTLIDPWAGPCNSTTGGSSWWAAQEAYRVPTVSKVMTHNAAPNMGNCSAEEQSNQSRNFSPGGTMYVSVYYRDNIDGTVAIHRIFRPDGSVWSSWPQGFTTATDASWWYYTIALPTSGTYYGIWRYEVTYNGQTVSTPFAIGATLPVDITRFTATPGAGKVQLDWNTTNEQDAKGFDIERSADGIVFERIGAVAAKNNGAPATYAFTDVQPKTGKNFYRLRMLDNNGANRLSKTVTADLGGEKLVEASPVPFANSLTIRVPSANSAGLTYRLLNAAGVVMAKGVGTAITVENTSAYPPGVYLLAVYEGAMLISQQKLIKL